MSSEITDKLKEINSTGKLTCTETELTEYLNYGLILPSGKHYITRLGKRVDIDIIKPKSYKFTIDLGDIIYKCEEIAQQENIKRIYCMTQETYNKYKEQQLIVNKSNIDYYRLFDKELWRVVII